MGHMRALRQSSGGRKRACATPAFGGTGRGSVTDEVLSLQRSAGNAAVAGWLSIGAGNKAVSGFASTSDSGLDMNSEAAASSRAMGEAETAGGSSGLDVQRTIGDGHDLTSPRFVGIEFLERVFDDQARLAPGASGESTRRVQQALSDLGSNLGPAGVDGIYGQMTAAAVRKFKADQALGSEQFGDVGPGTIGRLDQIFAGGGGGSGTPPVPPVPPPVPDTTMSSQTLAQAPDGSDSTTRVDVGPGERVRLRASARSRWTITGGLLNQTVGTTVIWTAPPPGGSVTITATPTDSGAGAPATSTFTVVPPDSIDMTRRSVVNPFGAKVAGAAMTCNIDFGHPEVSYTRCQWLEVPGPATGRSGYFAKRRNFDFFHHPNRDFITMQQPPRVVIDNCSSGAHPNTAQLPFEAGTWVWNIPNKYRAIGFPTQIDFITTQQNFEMSGPDGTITVEKQGADVSRTPAP